MQLIAMANLYIYGLYDPKDNALRYIGKSWDIRRRHILHRSQTKKALSYPTICTPVELWLGELKKAGLSPLNPLTRNQPNQKKEKTK